MLALDILYEVHHVYSDDVSVFFLDEVIEISTCAKTQQFLFHLFCLWLCPAWWQVWLHFFPFTFSHYTGPCKQGNVRWRMEVRSPQMI